jgi:hypothetical protein
LWFFVVKSMKWRLRQRAIAGVLSKREDGMKLSTMIFAMCFALAPFAADARGGGGMGGGMGGMSGGTSSGGMGGMSGMSAMSVGMNTPGDEMRIIHHRGSQCPHSRLRSKGLQTVPLFSLLFGCGAKF